MRELRWKTVVVGCCLAVAASAQPGPGGGGHHGPPPPEALQACQSSKDGDACAFDAPRGKVEGTCRTPPEQKELACVPAQPRGPGQQGPGQHSPTQQP